MIFPFRCRERGRFWSNWSIRVFGREPATKTPQVRIALMECVSMNSHSDLHNINGDLVMTTNVPGHEGVGRVVRGKNTEWDYDVNCG